MAATTNGMLLPSQLAAMPGEPGAFLLADAAASWEQVRNGVRSRYMWTPRITSVGDAYRNLQRQINVFLQRYGLEYATVIQGGRRIVDARRWRGIVYYRHTGAAAAIPGTSNHGKGVAVDVTGLGKFNSTRYNQFAEVATSLGWSNDEGKSVSEPWHWVYVGGAMPVSNTNDSKSVKIIELPEITLEELIALEGNVARLVNYNGNFAIAEEGGGFTELHTMDQVRTAIGLGMVSDKSHEDAIKLENPQMWNVAFEIRSLRRDQNCK